MLMVVTEGKVALTSVKTPSVPTKDMEVFYNPVMQDNRDVSIQMVRWLTRHRPVSVGLPLAGSGVRGVRFAVEIGKKNFKSICMNDHDQQAVQAMNAHVKDNNVDDIITTSVKDANIFLLESKGFDYIDIDPFGSPVPFLDAACKRISRGGLMAITATDTAPLSGTYPLTCSRRYHAVPLRCPMMHEIGVRILIRKIQMIGAQYDKACHVVVAYAKDHYFRVYVSVEKGTKKVDTILESHGWIIYNEQTHAFGVAHTYEQSMAVYKKIKGVVIGPLFLGSLHNPSIIDQIDTDNKTLHMIRDLNHVHDIVGWYLVPALAKTWSIGGFPQPKEVVKAISTKYRAALSIDNAQGIKTDMPLTKLVDVIRKLANSRI